MNNVLTAEQKILISTMYDAELDVMVDTIINQFNFPNIYEVMSFEDRMQEIIGQYKSHIENKRYKSMIRNSKISRIFYLNQICPDSSRGLSKAMYDTLLSMTWLKEGKSCLLSGPTGSGKSTLATALAVEAMKMGYPALFIKANELEALLNIKQNVELINYVKRLKRFKVLVIDDFGIQVMKNGIANKFLEIIDARYGIGSTIITTQVKADSIALSIEKGAARDAIVDRLFREGKDLKIELKGDSFRQSDKELKGESTDSVRL